MRPHSSYGQFVKSNVVEFVPSEHYQFIETLNCAGAFNLGPINIYISYSKFCFIYGIISLVLVVLLALLVLLVLSPSFIK